MNRIKIDIPDSFPFAIIVAIRITDLNYGGHVGNDSFLSLIHEARQQFLQSYGYSELSFGGIGLIMTDVAIEFKKELNYGDQVKISVKAEGFDKLGFDLLYKLEIVQEAGLVLAGRAKTGMLCFDYANRKKVPVPQEVLNKMGDVS
jgi:YbgC/YbaW family acyl-CoA thioester hydrolase